MPPETFDEKSARLSQAAAAEAERDRLYREQAARNATISWQRLLAILRGEAPTRESNEEWMARQRGMLPAAPPPSASTGMTAPRNYANPGPVMAPTLPAGMLPVYQPSPRPFSPDTDYIPAFIRG